VNSIGIFYCNETCMLLKHILSILVFGDDIMCPHPSNNAKNRSVLLILKIAHM
jgi:hypothetical protein